MSSVNIIVERLLLFQLRNSVRRIITCLYEREGVICTYVSLLVSGNLSLSNLAIFSF